MTKAEARQAIQGEIDRISTEINEKIDAYLSDEQISELVQRFVECFEKYCEKITKMQQSGEKSAIGYINFSWLRTNTLAGEYKFRIDAYDKNLYADCIDCSDKYDVSAIYSFLDEFEKRVDAARKKYAYALSAADVKQIVLEESMKYNLILLTLIQTGLKLAVETPSYQAVLCEEKFSIHVGEFRDAGIPIYWTENAQDEAVG